MLKTKLKKIYEKHQWHRFYIFLIATLLGKDPDGIR
jgi:hypothetical protein